MRKNKFNIYELAAKNDYMSSFEKYMIRQDDCLKSNNITVNENKIFFKIILEIDTTIKNLAALTVYN